MSIPPSFAAQSDRRNQSGQQMGAKGLRTRQRLIDTTVAMLATHRLRDLRVADIARQAKIAPGTFYLYFGDVTDAVLAALESLTFATPEMLALVAGDWNGAAALDSATRLVTAYIALWDEHHAILRVRNLASEEGDQRFIDVRLRAILPLLEALSQRAATAQAAGRIPAHLSPVSTAGALLAMLERLASVNRLNQRTTDSTPERVAESAAYILAQTLGS